jgi:hypothetical protein
LLEEHLLELSRLGEHSDLRNNTEIVSIISRIIARVRPSSRPSRPGCCSRMFYSESTLNKLRFRSGGPKA